MFFSYSQFVNEITRAEQYNNDMRIDKYLKVARIIKRRTVAKEACDGGRVSINDKVAKAGDEVRVGDLIDVRMGSGSVRVRVLSISEHVSKDGAKELYEVV